MVLPVFKFISGKLSSIILVPYFTGPTKQQWSLTVRQCTCLVPPSTLVSSLTRSRELVWHIPAYDDCHTVGALFSITDDDISICQGAKQQQLASLANMNLGAWKIEKKEKKKVGGETSCCYGFNRSKSRPAPFKRAPNIFTNCSIYVGASEVPWSANIIST